MATNVRAEYERIAGKYDKRWASYVWPCISKALEVLRLDNEASILDVACGTGTFCIETAWRFPKAKVLGLDLSKGMLSEALRKTAPGGRAKFICGTADKLPFPDAAFDAVVNMNSFHFFRQPQQTLAEFCRVLRDNGQLIVIDWCRDFLLCRLYDVVKGAFDPAHARCYSLEECEEILEQSGLVVTSAERFKVPLFWGLMRVTVVKKSSESETLE